MQTPVEIAWHNLDPQPPCEARVRERVARLEQFFDRITACHVVIEAAHQRQRKGNLYEVRVAVTLPGGQLQVNDKPGDVEAHLDLLVAVRDAFNAMERQLKRWKDQHTGRPDTHAVPLLGRVQELDTATGGGHIATNDGRLVYFHRNSLVSGDFEILSVGDPVELVVDRGLDAQGAHASTVRPISRQKYVDHPGRGA